MIELNATARMSARCSSSVAYATIASSGVSSATKCGTSPRSTAASPCGSFIGTG